MKKSKTVDPEEVADLDMAFDAEGKLIEKISLQLAIDLEVVMQEEALEPWIRAKDALEISADQLEVKDAGLSIIDKVVQVRDELHAVQTEVLRKNLETLVEATEDWEGLNEETQELIVTDLLTATMNTLRTHLAKAGGGGITAELKEGEKDKILEPLETAFKESFDLAKESLDNQNKDDRAQLTIDFQQLETVMEMTKEFSDAKSEDTADQIAKNDKTDRERIEFMKSQYRKIENCQKIIAKMKARRLKLQEADEVNFMGQHSSESEEDGEDDDKYSGSDDSELKREKARTEAALLEKGGGSEGSVTASKYEKLSSEDIEKEVDKCVRRSAAATARLRDLVLECWKTDKGGQAAHEQSATKADLKDLLKLKLGAKSKDTRSAACGRILMEVMRDLILKKPDAYPGFGPMLACYAGTNVSLSKFHHH